MEAHFLDTPVGKHFFFFEVPPLHPSVLKPNFHLSVRQVQHPGQLQPLLFVDIHVEEKLSLQFPDLEFRIRAALLAGAGGVWRGREGASARRRGERHVRPGPPQATERSAALLSAPPPGRPPAWPAGSLGDAGRRAGASLHPPARSSSSQSRATAGPAPPPLRGEPRGTRLGEKEASGAKCVPGPPPCSAAVLCPFLCCPPSGYERPPPHAQKPGGTAENRREEVRSVGRAGSKRESRHRQHEGRFRGPGAPGRPAGRAFHPAGLGLR